MDDPKMKNFDLKTLREIGNIGAGHAASALAGMINKKVMMDVCHVALVTIRDMAGILNHQHGEVLDVQLGFSGDINGSGYYLMSKGAAWELMGMLRDHSQGGDKVFDGHHLTAFKECGGILLSSYLKAISSLCKFFLVIAASHSAHNMDFVSNLLFGHHTADERVFCTETVFIEGENRVKVCFCLILDNRSLEVMFKGV